MKQMKKWNLMVSAADTDGKTFYQNFHVIERTPEKARDWLIDNYSNPDLKKTIKVTQMEELEDATLYLPGVVYKSGKAYFA